MKIALLTHSVRPRGGVVHTLELAEALRRRGHAITVIASAEPGERLFREVGFPVEAIALPPLQGDLVAQVAQRIDALVEALRAQARPGDHVVIMSNGAVENAPRRFVDALD